MKRTASAAITAFGQSIMNVRVFAAGKSLPATKKSTGWAQACLTPQHFVDNEVLKPYLVSVARHKSYAMSQVRLPG
jgi:hypothetical protein